MDSDTDLLKHCWFFVLLFVFLVCVFFFFFNTILNSIVPIHIYLLIYSYFREKCLLPLQLALESKSMKLAQQALAGMQVWLKSGVFILVGSGHQGNLGFSFEKMLQKMCLSSGGCNSDVHFSVTVFRI